ncbi:porin [Treponema succinifaciens]|uniref:porin n=1 Tax=Treponema succinifaciens TaxID=167 RepID=UPI0023F58C3B|nr:porin [Treponema succinifaciens]
MKKTLIAVAAAAALTATSAFAEITFGAWLRVLGSPIASTGEEVVAGMENSWGWGARTARIDINGVSEDGKAGFSMGVYNDVYDGLGTGDRFNLWVKPTDTVKISIGKYDSPDNGLRGDLCYGSWNWLRPYNWAFDGEGLTFDGIWRKGLMVEADPIDGLHLFAVIPMDKQNTYYHTAEWTYRNIQVGFGYAIEGVGKLKAQYIGDWSYTEKKTTKPGKTYEFDSKTGTGKLVTETVDSEVDETKTTGQIGVAFDLNAVENLYVTVGARFGIADKDYAPGYLKMAITAGASYQVSDAMKFSVDGGYKQYQDKFVGKNGDKKDNEFFVGAGVDYTIMDGLNLAADVRYKNIGYGKKGDDGAISFLVGVNKSVSSNGSLGIGFQGATNGCGLVTAAGGDSNGLVAGYNPVPGTVTGDGDEFVWAIPVSVSVWF